MLLRLLWLALPPQQLPPADFLLLLLQHRLVLPLQLLLVAG
jgi:hypothetical protein